MTQVVVEGLSLYRPGGMGRAMAVAALAAIGLAGCSGIPSVAGLGQVTQHGYVISQTALAQIPVGSSRDQVLIALGSPSTTQEFGGEVFYYISQTRKRPVAFLNEGVTDQRVVGVYFDQKQKVTKLAEYGLQDGKVFDFISRTTPTSGRDVAFLSQVLGSQPSAASVFGQK